MTSINVWTEERMWLFVSCFHSLGAETLHSWNLRDFYQSSTSTIWAENILTPRNSKLPKTRQEGSEEGNRADVSLCCFSQEPSTDQSCFSWTESYYKSQNALQQWCILLFNDNDWCITCSALMSQLLHVGWVVSLIKGSIKLYCYLQKYTFIHF